MSMETIGSPLPDRTSLAPSQSPFPSVDVVIPTFNWAVPLAKCLASIRKQEYGGKINVIVVDAGSTDETIATARSFDAEIIERVDSNPQGEGLNGRRQYGLLRSHSPLVWHLDGDNFVVEDTALRDLFEPFRVNPGIMLSVPYPHVGRLSTPFNRWWSYRTHLRLEWMRSRGQQMRGWTFVRDMDYGLMNGTLVRRSVLDAIGGWDQDVRILRRMKARSLNQGAIVPSAHIDSPTNSGLNETRRKFSSRVRKFGSMSEEEMRNYFADYDRPDSSNNRASPSVSYLAGFFAEPFESLSIYRMSHDAAAFCGWTLPLIYLSVALEHPYLTYRILRRNI